MLNKLTTLCFSPTGGTARVAGHLSTALSGSTEIIDLLHPVAPRSFFSEDVVLIAMPVFGGRIPAFALEQLRNFQGGRARAVVVSVFGNRDFDDALAELSDAAIDCGFRVIACAAPVAEHSMARSVGTGRPDAQDLAELSAFAKQVLDKLERGDDSVPPVPGNRPFEVITHGEANKGDAAPKWTPVASDACTQCGICAAECPAGAIPAGAPNTTDANRCIQCMRCTVVCPESARTLPAPVSEVVSGFLKMHASQRHENCFYL